MKRFFTCLLLFQDISANFLYAQPTVVVNEFYNVGDMIKMVNCDPTGITAGASGTGLTWNFSGMVPTGGYYTISVQDDTTSQFPLSNLLFSLPGNMYLHLQESSSDTYINGAFDDNTDVTIYYNNYNISKRPFTYGSMYIDTYQATIPPNVMHGTGVLTVTGDAYGTLVLPNGTYSNVLRIKKHQVERDTTGTVIVTTVKVAYMWFDTVHTAPLLQIDSTISVLGNVQRAMYLASPLAISRLNNVKDTYLASLSDRALVIKDDFVNGREYEVSLYDLTGVKIFKQDFVANGKVQRIDISNPIPPGLYVVNLSMKDLPITRQLIKVVKY